MLRRLVILQILLLAGLGSIWLLPASPGIQEAALNPTLPIRLTLSGWEGRGELSTEGSVEEKARLAPDTQFYRRDYIREVGLSDQPVGGYRQELVDELNAGIVMSGKDLSGSIHALERCLTAQGFNISDPTTMQVQLRDGVHTLPVRRLLCEKLDKESGTVQRSISYYWFVGHDSVTSNHIKRGLQDFYDRIFKGYDQKWGYVTVTAYLNGGPVYEKPRPGQKFAEGERPAFARDRISGRELLRRPLTPEQADKLVDEFISDLGPDIIKVEQVKVWPEE